MARTYPEMIREGHRWDSEEPNATTSTGSTPNVVPGRKVHPRFDASVRGQIFNTLEDARFSMTAKIYSLFILLVTLASVTLFLVESLPHYWVSQPLWINISEWTFAIIFSLDYCARLATARKPLRWLFHPFSIIDLVSTLPFYVSLVLSSFVKRLAVLRVVRLLRVFRIVRAARYAVYVHLLAATLKRSLNALLLLLFVMSVTMVFYSSLMFFAEQTGQHFNDTTHHWIRKDGTDSPFQSIFHAMWWAIVSVTTTGYGDVVPVTLLGKIVAGMTMVTGVVVIAFPIAVLGNSFATAWNELMVQQRQEKELKRLRKLVHAHRHSTGGGRRSPSPPTSDDDAAARRAVPLQPMQVTAAAATTTAAASASLPAVVTESAPPGPLSGTAAAPSMSSSALLTPTEPVRRTPNAPPSASLDSHTSAQYANAPAGNSELLYRREVYETLRRLGDDLQRLNILLGDM